MSDMNHCETTLTLINKLGLHARASAKLVKTAGHYISDIKVTYRDNPVNAKSIMDIMLLGAPFGAELTFTAEGNDASEAIDAIRELIGQRFGEAD